MHQFKPIHYCTAFLVALIVGAVFFPALHNQFVSWDDDLYVYNNIHIRSLDAAFSHWAFFDFHAANWHPLTWISHAVDYALWGMKPFGHHLASVVIHGLNSFLLVLLSLNLVQAARTQPPAGSLPETVRERYVLATAGLTGLLFGMHPLQVESVAWIAERKNVLCAFFLLLTLLSYLRYARTRPVATGSGMMPALCRGSYLLTIAFFVLALLSKPMAVTLPVILLIIDWFPLKRVQQRGAIGFLLLEKVPFFLLSAASSVITIQAQHSGGAVVSLQNSPLVDRVVVSFHTITSYLAKFLFPYSLSPMYPFPRDVAFFSPKYLLSFVVVLAITVAAVLVARRHKVWLAVWASFLVLLLPVLGIIRVGNQAMADRYVYLPSMGIALLVSVGIIRVFERLITSQRYRLTAIITASLVAVFLLLPVLTRKQIRIWENGTTLWRHVIRVEPEFSTAYNNLGVILLMAQNHDEAIKLFESAIKLEPSSSEALNNLAICYFDLKQHEKAYFYATSAISANSRHAGAYSTMGEILLDRKEYRQANDFLLKAIALDSGSPVRYFNVALSFEKLGELDDACRYWQRYLASGLDAGEYNEMREHMREIGCPE